MKKTIAFAAGLFLLTAPLLAGAQTVMTTIVQPSPYAALVSLYTELIQLLQQEIAVLENAPQQQTSSFSASPVSAPSTASNIQQLNAPGSVALSSGGIAEIRNESFYFTLLSLTSTSATIQLTPVGCWNSFPSDTPPQIRCMIATVPIPPQTLSIGQSYASANYGITLSEISNTMATFSVNTPSTLQ